MNRKAESGAEKESFKNILVVKLADIGDLLTATPALRALRETFPASHISVLVTPETAVVLEGSALVDTVLTFDKHKYDRIGGSARLSSIRSAFQLLGELRENSYDCVIILHHLVTRWGALKYAALAFATGARRRIGLNNGRGWFLTNRVPDNGFGFMHEVEYGLSVVRSIGATSENVGLDLPITPDDVAVADHLLAGITARPMIAVHPGSGKYSLLRRWPAEHYSKLGDSLASIEGASIIMVGGPDEIDLCREVAENMHHKPLILAGKTSIRQLAAVLKRCDAFVGNDSGVMHIAASMGTKVVAIFGPSNHRAWAPWTASGPIGENVASGGAIVGGMAVCSPCLYGADWGRLGRRPCKKNIECLRRLTPDVVLRVVRQVLAAREPEQLLRS